MVLWYIVATTEENLRWVNTIGVNNHKLPTEVTIRKIGTWLARMTKMDFVIQREQCGPDEPIAVPFLDMV
jgi:hypothetical protein